VPTLRSPSLERLNKIELRGWENPAPSSLIERSTPQISYDACGAACMDQRIVLPSLPRRSEPLLRLQAHDTACGACSRESSTRHPSADGLKSQETSRVRAPRSMGRFLSRDLVTGQIQHG